MLNCYYNKCSTMSGDGDYASSSMFSCANLHIILQAGTALFAVLAFIICVIYTILVTGIVGIIFAAFVLLAGILFVSHGQQFYNAE